MFMEDPKIILWPVIALWGLYISFKKDRGEHRLVKFVHTLLVLYLVAEHAKTPLFFCWTVTHPATMIERFYEPVGIFPPWATLSLSLANIFFGVIAVMVGISFAYRKGFARRIFLWLIPPLCINDAFALFLDGMKDPIETSTYAIIAISSSIVAIPPYTVMLLFYSRRSVASALFELNARSTTDTYAKKDVKRKEDAIETRRESPNGTRQAIFRKAGEIHFGPNYYFLETDEWNLWSRIFGDRSAWSEDDRFLAVQEWWNTVESQGPQTSLVVLDLEMERQCTFDSIPGFATPLSFNGTLLRYEEDRWESGQRVKSEHEVDVAKIYQWEDL